MYALLHTPIRPVSKTWTFGEMNRKENDLAYSFILRNRNIIKETQLPEISNCFSDICSGDFNDLSDFKSGYRFDRCGITKKNTCDFNTPDFQFFRFTCVFDSRVLGKKS